MSDKTEVDKTERACVEHVRAACGDEAELLTELGATSLDSLTPGQYVMACYKLDISTNPFV